MCSVISLIFDLLSATVSLALQGTEMPVAWPLSSSSNNLISKTKAAGREQEVSRSELPRAALAPVLGGQQGRDYLP